MVQDLGLGLIVICVDVMSRVKLADPFLFQNKIATQNAPYRPKVDLTEVMKRLRLFFTYHHSESGMQMHDGYPSIFFSTVFQCNFSSTICSTEKEPAKKQDFVQVFGIFTRTDFVYVHIMCRSDRC